MTKKLTVTVRIADFSDHPIAITREGGEKSAQEFKEDVLYPAFLEAIEKECTLSIDVSGVSVYDTAWLYAVFYGMLCYTSVTPEMFTSVLLIHTGTDMDAYDTHVPVVWGQIKKAAKARDEVNNPNKI